MGKFYKLTAILITICLMPVLAILYDVGIGDWVIAVSDYSSWLLIAVAIMIVFSFMPLLRGWRPEGLTAVFSREKGSFRRTRAASIARRYCRHSLGIFGLIILIFFTIVSVFPNWFLPQESVPYTRQEMQARGQGPSLQHPLGLTIRGNDVRTIIVNGAAPTLSFALRATLIAIVMGGLLGGLAGYIGGPVDRIITMITETVLAFPTIFIIMTVLMITRDLDHRLWLVAAYGVASASKIVRAEALRLRELEFVQAARANGCGQLQIIFTHILRNAFPSLIVQGTIFAGQAVLLDAYISFLGVFGASGWAGDISLVVRSYRALSIYREPWLMNAAGASLFLLIMSFNTVGDALRDALEVKI